MSIVDIVVGMGVGQEGVGLTLAPELSAESGKWPAPVPNQPF